ncbi:aKG-HExxH-type peptide beta-hydroxylase [Streptomyces sp. NPDC002671]
MTLASAIPPEVFAELGRTRPRPAAHAVLRAALHARRMLLVKSLLVKVDRRRVPLSPEGRRHFERDWALLERAERADAAAVRDVLDYPTIGAWLAGALAAPDGPAFERHLAHLGGVAVAAAVRAGCPVRGTLTAPTGSLTLPGIGVLRCPSGQVRLDGYAGLVRMTDSEGESEVTLLAPKAGGGPGVRQPAGGGNGWAAVRMLPGGTSVLDDLDPYRVPPRGIGPSALPAAEHPQVAHRLWADAWRAVHDLLSATDPARAVETRAVLRVVVPLAQPREREGVPVSATLRAAPGAALTQLPAAAGELMEALVHEIHHTKLAVLDGLVPLCRPDGGTLHRVGWRPDPRPVPAVIQGAYAHLALTDLAWRSLNGPAASGVWRRRAARQFETYRDQVADALLILRESDELTIAGREFVGHMGRHHAGLGLTARSLA